EPRRRLFTIFMLNLQLAFGRGHRSLDPPKPLGAVPRLSCPPLRFDTERGDTGNAPLRRCDHTTRSVPADNKEQASTQPGRRDSKKVLQKKHAIHTDSACFLRVRGTWLYLLITMSCSIDQVSRGRDGEKTGLTPVISASVPHTPTSTRRRRI